MKRRVADEIAHMVYTQGKMEGMIQRALDMVLEMENEITALREQLREAKDRAKYNYGRIGPGGERSKTP